MNPPAATSSRDAAALVTKDEGVRDRNEGDVTAVAVGAETQGLEAGDLVAVALDRDGRVLGAGDGDEQFLAVGAAAGREPERVAGPDLRGGGLQGRQRGGIARIDAQDARRGGRRALGGEDGRVGQERGEAERDAGDEKTRDAGAGRHGFVVTAAGGSSRFPRRRRRRDDRW